MERSRHPLHNHCPFTRRKATKLMKSRNPVRRGCPGEGVRRLITRIAPMQNGRSNLAVAIGRGPRSDPHIRDLQAWESRSTAFAGKRQRWDTAPNHNGCDKVIPHCAPPSMQSADPADARYVGPMVVWFNTLLFNLCFISLILLKWSLGFAYRTFSHVPLGSVRKVPAGAYGARLPLGSEVRLVRDRMAHRGCETRPNGGVQR
jgi:hypothetical protein